MITVKLDDKELKKAIKNINKTSLKAQKKVKLVVKGTGLIIETGAKRRVPVDTGRLKSSILRTPKTDFFVTVGTNVEYAQYVEYGTSKNRKQPFLFPAAEAERQRYLDRIRKALQL